MVSVLKYSHTQDVAQAFSKALEEERNKFTPRPYNRHNPKNTIWWVVPGTDWPAYKYGKFIFKDNGPNINIGLNVEKGFGQQAAAIYTKLTKKEMVINSDWLWEDFVRDIENNQQIYEALNEVQENIDKILVEIGIVLVYEPGEYDPNAPKPDRFIFKFDHGKLEYLPDISREERSGVLKEAETLKDIPRLLRQIQEIEWCWVDFDLNIPFKKYNQADSKPDRVYDEYDLEYILRPIESWVR